MKHINIALFVPHEGCPHCCCFCNQRSISGSTKRLTASDVDSAVKTALSTRENVPLQLAFFGGSFTAIDRGYMLELLRAAKPYVDSGALRGIRVSTRPDAIDDEVLDVLAEYGVTAIELGCQSMDDEVLSLSERGHGSYHVVEACGLIKSHGIELGVQMMTGLPGDTEEKCIETAKRLIDLKPDTARIYPTVVLKDTKLEKLYLEGSYRPQTLEEATSLCARLLLMFEQAGVPVIRLGLHSGGTVEEGYVAGVYHPAFRELCEGEIFYNSTLELIEKSGIKPGELHLHVPMGRASCVAGHKKRNRVRLKEKGFDIKISQESSLSGFQIYITTNEGVADDFNST